MISNGVLLARPNVPPKTWDGEIEKLAQESWLTEAFPAQVYGMGQLPRYRDVTDGAMGGFFTVREGFSPLAAEVAAEKTKRYPYSMFTRISVEGQLPLLMRQGVTFPNLGLVITTTMSGQTSLPVKQTGLRANISFLVNLDSMIDEFNQLLLLATAGTVDLLGMEDGGPFMAHLATSQRVHCMLKTRVPSEEVGWALWVTIMQSDKISYPVAFIERPKEAVVQPFIPPVLTAVPQPVAA
jgi:hypothetical protein